MIENMMLMQRVQTIKKNESLRFLFLSRRIRQLARKVHPLLSRRKRNQRRGLRDQKLTSAVSADLCGMTPKKNGFSARVAKNGHVRVALRFHFVQIATMKCSDSIIKNASTYMKSSGSQTTSFL